MSLDALGPVGVGEDVEAVRPNGIHHGRGDYLNFSLRQASHTNPRAGITLLGDAGNAGLSVGDHRPIESFVAGAREFADALHPGKPLPPSASLALLDDAAHPRG